MMVRINNNPQDIDLTISIMQAMLPNAVKQTAEIAKEIRQEYGRFKANRIKGLWKYLKETYEYKPDPLGIELIRSPSISFKIRKKGIDCEDFSLIAAGVCVNLMIECNYRIVDYNGMGWSHIYLVIKNGSKEIILDPVHEKFNKQDSFVKFRDFDISATQTKSINTMKKQNLLKVTLGKSKAKPKSSAKKKSVSAKPTRKQKKSGIVKFLDKAEKMIFGK